MPALDQPIKVRPAESGGNHIFSDGHPAKVPQIEKRKRLSCLKFSPELKSGLKKGKKLAKQDICMQVQWIP